MDVTFVIAGSVRREYILPHVGTPVLDEPGGSVLYACGGLLPWAEGVGVLARVGEDFPRAWLQLVVSRGVDVRGISILPQSIDLRDFVAYDSEFGVTRGSPVSQFARRKLPFPKTLLGYQAPAESQEDPRRPDPLSPSISDIPGDYRDARAVHLCALDFISHNRLAATFKSTGVTTLTVDPSPGYMAPSFLQDMRLFLGNVNAFLPTEARLRGLFWGHTNDLWEMMEAVGSFGCEIVAVRRGGGGQAVLDAKSGRRWEVPAYPARAADPTGSGDAYAGGFLAGLKQTYDPLEAALHADISASLAIEGSGPFYSLSVLTGLAEARLLQLRELAREA
jgi:hypothetical protein